ncbi:general transcription factor 3C polypeptide 2 [Aplochiton taeniatus]
MQEAEAEVKTAKRKSNVMKQQQQQEVREDQVETPEVPEETTPSGRPRRGAAKADSNDLEFASGDSEQTPRTSKKNQGPKEPKRGRGRKRKAPDFDSDSDNKLADKDFVPDATRSKPHGTATNGLPNTLMQPVWNCNRTTKEFRDEHCNTWVFPEWIPSEKHWHFLSESESDLYLPQELESPSFTISREGINEDPPLFHKLNRFEGVPAHPVRWDVSFFTGGPVWAMDWCPCPDGSIANQYVALSTHRTADEQHLVHRTYTKPGLVQVWNLGQLQYDTRPPSCPCLSYGLAQDKGFVWNLKWCPAGTWELPSTSRKAPLLPRLGLLAVATSNGQITIYSLPHPDALHNRRKLPKTVTLQLGSSQASRGEESGQVLSMDWVGTKPHDLLAAGFHDGVVGLWNLCSQSVLLRIRSPDQSITLMPFHCFIAHDQSTRALAFCPASRDLLATAGDDRLIKMWNLKKTHEPISFQRRHLSREVSWPLNSPGVFVAQEIVYAPFGLHGVHYFDGGFFGYKPLFLIPRPSTMWTLSTSDWLNLVVTADMEGDVVFGLLPKLGSFPCYIKRVIERRFRTFKKSSERAPWKRMQATETKKNLNLDPLPLAAVHKVRFSPNMSSQTWVLSGGQSGLVRAHCLRALTSQHVQKMEKESQAQFSAIFPQPEEGPGGGESSENASVVRSTTQQL